MIQKFTAFTLGVLVALAALVLSSAAHANAKPAPAKTMPRMVAYDAKDKKYYSVAYAKSHGMHDKGGDPLIIVPFKSLPKTAKMSHAMHGKL